MFRFYGRIGRKHFALAAVLRIALYAASVVAFPFLLAALARWTRCGNDTCGALGLVSSMAFKPIVFVLFVFSFVGICVRRSRDAGMPAWIGLVVPLFLAADYTFLAYVMTPWSFGFATGVLHLALPYHALIALACVLFLCVLPTRVTPPGTRNPFGVPGLIAIGLGAFVAFNALWKLLAGLVFGVQVMLAIGRWMWWMHAITPYALAGFAASLCWIAWRERRYQEAQPIPPLPQRREPFASLLALAMVLTLLVFHMNLPKELQPWWLASLIQFTSAILPTLALNFVLVLAIWLVITRRRIWTVALLVVAVLPFGHWAYARWAKELEIARERAEVASIPATRPARLPATLVIDSRSVTGIRAAWALPPLQSVVSRGAYSKLMQFERPGPGASGGPKAIDALPDEYLLLKIGRSSAFAKERQMYSAAGGPYELRLVSGQRDELIAVWYRTYNPEVADVPVLTSIGWSRPGSNSATTDEIEDSVRAFLVRALAS
jgi:uncharacterized membrane protein YhaH (DUF805 family)